MTSQPSSGTLRTLEAEPPIECGLTCPCTEQCEYVAVGLELAAELGKIWPPFAAGARNSDP